MTDMSVDLAMLREDAIARPLESKRLLQMTYALFIPSAQSVSAWPDHRPAQLVQQCPSGPVIAQAQHALQSQCADAILLGSDLPHRPKPDRQGQFAVRENRSCQHRSFPTALNATPEIATDRQAAGRANRANKPLRPAQREKISPTIGFVAEALFQFQQCARIIFDHPQKYYRLRLVESGA